MFRWNAQQILYQWERGKLVWKEHGMAKPRKHTPEQIVNILRQIEMAVANGKRTRRQVAKPASRSRPTTAGAKSMGA